MNESREIMESIRKLVRAIRLSSAATERELGVSSAQLYVLQKLVDGKPASLGELASRTLTDQSSVSVVVSKLVKAGYLAKETSESDRRSVSISLTPKGARILASGPEPVQRRLVNSISRMPAIRRHHLASTLKELLDHAGLSNEPAPLFFEEPPGEQCSE